MSILSRWHKLDEQQKILLAESLHNGQLYGFLLSARSEARNDLLSLQPDLANPQVSVTRHMEAYNNMQLLNEMIEMIEESKQYFAARYPASKPEK